MSKNKEILLHLEQLREFLRSEGYTACIIPQNDPHMSEYVADYYKIREFFSGFNGSAGTLVVGIDFAILWTDGRYFLQAESQLENSSIELYRSGVENVPTMVEFLEKKVGMNGVVVANANVISALFDVITGADTDYTGSVKWGKTITCGYMPKDYDKIHKRTF